MLSWIVYGISLVQTEINNKSTHIALVLVATNGEVLRQLRGMTPQRNAYRDEGRGLYPQLKHATNIMEVGHCDEH